MLILVKLHAKYVFTLHALGSAHEKFENLGRARREEPLSRFKLKWAFLIDSDVELLMYLIQCNRIGS